MTAYGISPVGAHGVERHREEVIEIPSRAELMRLLAETIAVRDAAQEMWREAVAARLVERGRLQRASRVLASLGRMSPRMAGVVAAAGREIWELDRADRLRQSKAARKAREIWRLDE